MARKKQRTVFWVVSTHVVTTGFVCPLIAGMIGSSFLALDPSSVAVFLGVLAIQAIGYIGGAFYSLSYLRDVATIENPTRCAKPAIITFVVLAVIGFGVNVAAVAARRYPGEAIIACILGLAAYYVLICYAFARITQRGFAQMESQTTDE